MRRVGVLFLAGVMLAGSAATGCATSEPAEQANASASRSQSSQAEVESGAATPEPSDSNSPASPSAPVQESTGDAETPRTESGSDPRPVKAPRPVGASLSELAAMLIDPLEEAQKAGIDIQAEFPYQIANPSFPRRPEGSVPSDFGSPGPPPGFVVGYSMCVSASDDEDRWEVDERGEYYERGQYYPLLSASVWAFDSKAHAREYVDSLAPNILDQADQPVRAALPAAGNGAVIWRSGSGQHFKDLALIRRGNLVGEVVTQGFTTDGHGEAIELLARALADQMAQVNPRARPYDAAAVRAAPCPSMLGQLSGRTGPPPIPWSATAGTHPHYATWNPSCGAPPGGTHLGTDRLYTWLPPTTTSRPNTRSPGPN